MSSNGETTSPAAATLDASEMSTESKQRIYSDQTKKAMKRFQAKVQEKMEYLMTEHGFSRERAASALIREISATKPSEDEVFGTMINLGLTREQATGVITVASAVDGLREKGMSETEAVDELTRRLNDAKLESDEFHSGDDLDNRTTTKTGKELKLLPVTSGDREAPPRVAAEKLEPSKTISKVTEATAGAASAAKQRKRNDTVPQASASSTPESSATRPRAGSVVKGVAAKLEADTTTKSNNVQQPVAKRARVDSQDTKPKATSKAAKIITDSTKVNQPPKSSVARGAKRASLPEGSVVVGSAQKRARQTIAA